MKLYMQQKVFSLGDKLTVCDENQQLKYSIKGKMFSVGKKLTVYDAGDNEVAFIKQKLSFLPKFQILRNGELVTEVQKKFTFIKPKFEIPALGWTVLGDFTAHEYEIKQGETMVARVSKEWLAWGDTYQINIVDGVDEVNAVAVVLVVDAVLASGSSSVTSD